MFKRPSRCIFRHVNMLLSTSVHHHRVPVYQKVPKDLRLKSVLLGDYTDGRVLGIEKFPALNSYNSHRQPCGSDRLARSSLVETSFSY